ncbi:DUF456 domain-containing protein [Bacillus sp. FJAT-45350]|uniref:DUF456 domain-containing protein n=1 Tax=Bacillus sp. FJAT-45350 TaxID=2011014 RepID=UPI000BB8AD25|nr:DUF456 domain-containing protein [Bacillus sp. FJAT-45350]
MDILISILIAILFILSFVGLIYPIIPSVLLIWGGVALYHFFINADALSWWTWGTYILLTVVLFLTDYLANLYFVQRYGGSKWGMRAVTVGIIIGCFVIPPFGILIVPFILVLFTELFQNKSPAYALKVATGTIIAFLSGVFAKGIIQTVMIVVFIIDML